MFCKDTTTPTEKALSKGDSFLWGTASGESKRHMLSNLDFFREALTLREIFPVRRRTVPRNQKVTLSVLKVQAYISGRAALLVETLGKVSSTSPSSGTEARNLAASSSCSTCMCTNPSDPPVASEALKKAGLELHWDCRASVPSLKHCIILSSKPYSSGNLLRVRCTCFS